MQVSLLNQNADQMDDMQARDLQMEPHILNDRESSGNLHMDQVSLGEQPEPQSVQQRNDMMSERIEHQSVQQHNLFSGYREDMDNNDNNNNNNLDQDVAAPGNFNQGHGSIDVQNIDNDNLQTQIMRVDDEECINDKEILFIDQQRQEIQMARQGDDAASSNKHRRSLKPSRSSSKRNKVNKTLEMLQELQKYEREAQRPRSANAMKGNSNKKNNNGGANQENVAEESSASTAVFDITNQFFKNKTQTLRLEKFRHQTMNTNFGPSDTQTPL